MANDDWTINHQRATLDAATRWGAGWTVQDVEFLTAFDGVVSDTEIALALGRTLFAIQTAKHAIREGRATTTLREARRTPWSPSASYRGWMEGMGDG